MIKSAYKTLTILIIIIFNVNISTSQKELHPDPLKYEKMPFDVISYQVYLDLMKYKQLETKGECKILVKRDEIYDGDYFIFHLRNLKVDRVTANNIDVAYEVSGGAGEPNFYYKADYPDSTSDLVEFTISYSGKMNAENEGPMLWGGVHYEEAVLYNLGVTFGADYVSAARHWMPCFDLPQDKATFKGTFKVPSNCKAASNGILTEEKKLGDTAVEFTWQHGYPAATYMLNFAVGQYSLINYFDYKIPINIYTLLIDSAKSHFAYSEVPAMNDCFEELFGSYPFDKIGYANTKKGAMEHQTMISMPRSVIVNLYESKNTNNLIAAHELAHSWFGGSVTPIDFRHAWLNESFAAYSEALWFESRNSRKIYLLDLLDKSNIYINQIAPYEGIMPLYDFPRQQPSSNYPQTIYLKGAVVLGMLRYQLEEQGFDFFEIIKEYLNKFKYSNSSTQDLLDVVNSKTNQDWGWFFDQWIYKKGWPQIKILFDEKKNGRYSNGFTIYQDQTDLTFKNIPLELTLYYNNTLDTTFVVNLSQQSTKVHMTESFNFLIDSVRINTAEIVTGLYELISVDAVTNVEDSKSRNFQYTFLNDILNINFQSDGRFCSLNIFDVLGKNIYNNELIQNTGMNSFRVNTSSFPDGVYFINLVIDNKIFSKTISIAR